MGVLVLEKDLGAAVIFYITYVLMVYVATSRPVFWSVESRLVQVPSC